MKTKYRDDNEGKIKTEMKLKYTDETLKRKNINDKEPLGRNTKKTIQQTNRNAGTKRWETKTEMNTKGRDEKRNAGTKQKIITKENENETLGRMLKRKMKRNARTNAT